MRGSGGLSPAPVYTPHLLQLRFGFILVRNMVNQCNKNDYFQMQFVKLYVTLFQFFPNHNKYLAKLLMYLFCVKANILKYRNCCLFQGKTGLEPQPCGEKQDLVLSPYGYGICQNKPDKAVNIQVSPNLNHLRI